MPSESFFEKLKKGMEIEELPKEQLPKEPSLPKSKEGKGKKKSEKTTLPTVTEGKPLAKKEKVVKKKKERGKKITIKMEPVVAPIAAPADANPASVARATSAKETASAGKEEKKWFKPARQSFALQNLGGPDGQLTVDVYQTNEEIVIQSAIAGVEPEDLDIAIENDVVTIKGSRERPPEKEERNYFYQECYWGRFSREIILPAEVDNLRVQASMKKGILTIRIPKIEKEKRKRITVKE